MKDTFQKSSTDSFLKSTTTSRNRPFSMTQILYKCIYFLDFIKISDAGNLIQKINTLQNQINFNSGWGTPTDNETFVYDFSVNPVFDINKGTRNSNQSLRDEQFFPPGYSGYGPVDVFPENSNAPVYVAAFKSWARLTPSLKSVKISVFNLGGPFQSPGSYGGVNFGSASLLAQNWNGGQGPFNVPPQFVENLMTQPTPIDSSGTSQGTYFELPMPPIKGPYQLVDKNGNTEIAFGEIYGWQSA